MAHGSLSPRLKHRGILPAASSLPILLVALALASCGGRSGGGPGSSPDAGTSPGGDSIAIRDAEGQTVRLARPAERVISLAPNITEIVFAIGAGAKLVGRTTYCDYPPAALAVPPVGDIQTLNYETVIAARPDLILMTHAGNIKSNYEKLRDLGFMACTIGDESVGGIIGTIDTVGLLVGRRDEARRLGETLTRRIDSLRALGRKTPAVTTFIVVDKVPLITAATGFLAEELEIAGADNIAKGGLTAYPKYSREELLRRDPEVIIVPGMSFSMIDDLLAAYPEWKRLRAVREHRVYVLPHNTIFRPGPRIAASIGLLYRALHGADPRALFDEAMMGER
jgi:iron complex transport system substrate-binding protein